MSRLVAVQLAAAVGLRAFRAGARPVNKVSGDGYPPYNIEQLGENELRITLAVAGFTMGDLTITIEDNQLVIRGKRPMTASASISIAASRRANSSARSCSPRDRGAGAWLDNGLLHVDLIRAECRAAGAHDSIQGGESARTNPPAKSAPQPIRHHVSDNSRG